MAISVDRLDGHYNLLLEDIEGYVMCIDVQNPTVIDYIDLCSPTKKQRRPHCPIKRRDKVRRCPRIACNSPIEAVQQRGGNGDEPDGRRAKEISCRICFASLFDCIAMSAACGHMFCKACLDRMLRLRRKCPMCKRPLKRNRVFRVYL